MTRRTAAALALLLLGAGLGACTTGTVPPAPGSTPSAGVTNGGPGGTPSPASTSSGTEGGPATTAAVPPAGAAGINGRTVTDGCPIVTEPPCPDKPVPAHLSIMDSSGRVVATPTSGSDGRFSVTLAPGTYTVVATGLSGPFNRSPGPVTVSVTASGYTTVTIRFDSGMR